MSMFTDERLLTTREAAAYLGCSEVYLAVKRTAKVYASTDKPKFCYVGGTEARPRIAYKKSDLDAFLARKVAKKEARLAKKKQIRRQALIEREGKTVLMRQGKRISRHGEHIELDCKEMLEHLAFLDIPLRPRDREVVTLLAQGYTLGGVGNLLKLTGERIRHLYNRACRVYESFLQTGMKPPRKGR